MFDAFAKLWFAISTFLDMLTNIVSAGEKVTKTMERKAEAFDLESQEKNKQKLAELRAKVNQPPNSNSQPEPTNQGEELDLGN